MPLIQAEKLMSFSESILLSSGVPSDDARHVANSLVMGNLTGHDSHGVNMLPVYVKRIRRGVIKPGAKIEITKEASAYALVDGNWNFGQIIASFVIETAIRKAELNGLSLVSAYNCNHTGRLGEYCSKASERGFIGIMLVNAPPSVAPWGGAKRKLGTNPICIAIPRKNASPIVLDMATSVVANGRVALKVGTGERIPEGWAIDADGRPTTNPEDFEKGGAMLPVGTYKGYGLGLAIDMLCGALTMSGGCNRIPLDGANGVFALVIKSDIFVPKDEFASSVEDIVQFVLDCPLQKGFRQILLPGQPEVISLEERTKHGIPIHEVLWAKLKSLAVENGVPLPSQ